MTEDNHILVIPLGGTYVSEPYDDPFNPPWNVKTLRGADNPIPGLLPKLSQHERLDMFHLGLEDQHRLKRRSESFNKDSQYLTRKDAKDLADIIYHDDHRLFLLPSGTNFEVRNASWLEMELQKLEKKWGEKDQWIGFCGSMVPISMDDTMPAKWNGQINNNGRKVKCDGIDSLNFAIDNLENRDSGIYVVGRDAHTKRLDFFRPHEAEKNWEASKADLVFSLSHL